MMFLAIIMDKLLDCAVSHELKVILEVNDDFNSFIIDQSEVFVIQELHSVDIVNGLSLLVNAHQVLRDSFEQLICECVFDLENLQLLVDVNVIGKAGRVKWTESCISLKFQVIV